MLPRRRIERDRSGEIRLRLRRAERALVRALITDVRARLEADTDDAALRRLFPPAYGDDEEAESEYRSLVHDELLDGRLRALRVVEETLGANRLSEDEAEAWLRALNDLRLVLGTRLDVSEETYTADFDPRDRDLVVFAYLSWLQEQLVEVVAAGALDAAE